MTITKQHLNKLSDYLWEIPKTFRKNMRVPARFYASEKMLSQLFSDRSLEQLVNVSTLPGIQKYSLAMPDIHEGYGFPIGGVAGIDAQTGIISPGGVGYDINCLPGNTNILLQHGTHISIKELENNWGNFDVEHVNLDNFNLKKSSIGHFLKKYNNPSIYQITTQSGEKIEVTDDHPIYTKAGMKEAKNITKKDFIATYPFKGIKYEEPSNETIIDQKDIYNFLLKLGKTSRGSAINQILSYLEKQAILPLRYNSPQLPYLVKIMGYVLGGGSVSFINQKRGTVWFYGDKNDLEDIRQDIIKIGFTPSKVYQRHRQHQLTNAYKKNYKFSRIEYSFKTTSTAFAALLVVLGIPYDSKTHKSYKIPSWLLKAPLWQKRLFLAAFFGAELSSPTGINNFNFYCPALNINKSQTLEANAKEFLKQITKFLNEFGIQCASIKKVSGLGNTGNQGQTVGFRLQILSEAKNLIQFFEKINFEYNNKKHQKANLAIAYLKFKLKVIKEREEIRKIARKLYHSGISSREIIKKLTRQFVPKQFIEHSLWCSGGEKPRINFDFIRFKDFKNKFSLGKKGLIWEKVERIEKLPYHDWVYDLTINNENHNFIANSFVVSNCGVRLLVSPLSFKDIQNKITNLANQIQRDVPSGVGRGGELKLNSRQLDLALKHGARWAVQQGFGTEADLQHLEENGEFKIADPALVSEKAKRRGADQLGTLGAGNHFLEIQKVAEVFDKEIAKKWELAPDKITIMIHTGSRGLGHQVCTDYVRLLDQVIQKYKIHLPDRELACAPFQSSEGQRYFKAMAAAANFAWCNRQMLMHLVRKSAQQVLKIAPSRLAVLYDVAHNIAKLEIHDGRQLVVHRKGATRSFPEQPVIIPGSMGTASYVLIGTQAAMEQTFGSTCHGAGRRMSRTAAKKQIDYNKLKAQLESKGIITHAGSAKGLLEEAPQAYKDIDDVVEVVHQAGIAKKVVRLVPLAVIKG